MHGTKAVALTGGRCFVLITQPFIIYPMAELNKHDANPQPTHVVIHPQTMAVLAVLSTAADAAGMRWSNTLWIVAAAGM